MLASEIEAGGTLSQKFHKEVDRVFTFADGPENPLTFFVRTCKVKPIQERALLRAMLTSVRNALPKDLVTRRHEKLFAHMPIDIPDTAEGRTLKKIGSGYINTVYLLEGQGSASWAIGVRRSGFETSSSAWDYAIGQQRDYEKIKGMFSHIPQLIPNEWRILYDRHDGKPGVMFFREFVEGPIRDVFDFSKEELQARIGNNPNLNSQMTGFSTVCMENIDDYPVDLFGKNNLVITGSSGSERLVLLEPHTCDSNPSPETKQEIHDKIVYLNQIIKDVNGNEGIN